MDQTRRDFIKRSAMGSALIALGGGSLISCKPTVQIRELGLIMGVLKNELNLDYKGTIRKVADIGYKYLEIGNYPGRSREDFKEFLKELNLVPIAGGSSIREMMDDKKVLIVNLSKGKFGEENSAFLGSMLVTSIYLAAMSRAKTRASCLSCLTLAEAIQRTF